MNRMVGETYWQRVIFFYIPLFMFLVLLLFPFYWMIQASIKSDRELYNIALSPFYVRDATLDHFRYLFENTQFLLWMFNTFIPLDVIYLDEDREPVAAMTMHPCPRPQGASNADWQAQCQEASRTYTSNSPARYAIELPAGWLAERGLPLSRATSMRFRW